MSIQNCSICKWRKIKEAKQLINNEVCISLFKEEIEKKGQVQLTVHGDSMLPTLLDNQSVIIRKFSCIKIGDIIAYYFFDDKKAYIIIHRVLFVRKTYVLTKGDNNNFIDPLKIRYKMILGKIQDSN